MISLSQVTKLRLLSVLLVTLLFAWAAPALAANIYVDSTCTLDDAIKAANKDEEEDSCEAGDGDDVIIMTRDATRHNTLRVIESDITINGQGFTLTMKDRKRAFKVDDGDLTIRNLHIEHQAGRSSSVFEVDDGSLTLIDVTASNCRDGIKADNSDVSIQGNSNICDLPHDELITGHGTFSINVPAPLPPDTCGSLPGMNASVSATYGHRSGVQCRHLDGSGIGVQSIVDAGFIAAVDVWGYVEQGVEICFPQLGSITFLDAATSPRAVSTMDSYSRGNSTCAHLTRPGTVVLVPGAPTSVAPAAPAARADTATSAVSGCGVHAVGHLKFFASPSSDAEIIGYITRGTTMTFVSRIPGWYQVSHRGLTGWVGGKYASGGAC